MTDNYIRLSELSCIFYSKFYRKSISESRLQLSVIEKKVISQIICQKAGNFTLNPYVWSSLSLYMKQSLNSKKEHYPNVYNY